MRIISGILGGRVFTVPKDGMRPTMGRTREAVFSSLTGCIQNARVLDLFAGSGSLGLEAWSRGAAHVTAVEKNPGHWKILRNNFQTLEDSLEPGSWQAVQADVYDFLKRADGTFDLIFADPPYDEADLPGLLHAAAAVLAPGGLLIFEMRSKSPFETGPDWTLLKEKVYGESRVLFLRHGTSEKV
jgi:16S rRNA (guanine966-N2)-methyltransferase